MYFLFLRLEAPLEAKNLPVYHCKPSKLVIYLFNALFYFYLVSYSLHYRFIYIYSCLVRIILSFNLCLFVSIHFSDKNVLIVVCKSLNVNFHCNRRYIG
jgi:hypothetical protein